MGEIRKYEIVLEYSVKDGNIDDMDKIKSLAKLVRAQFVSAKIIRSKRTSQQNRALHLWFTLLAEALNDAGFDMRKTIREGVDIPWSSETIKEYLWRPVQKAKLQKDSTTDLTTNEIDIIFEIINRHIGERTGVHVPFPSLTDETDSANI